ncbi:MAG: 3-phosphoshikimate 1-carboxyvinyltransferase [Candidatus Lambdaproteobacteria bacterium]|nr:3-phosphoshikimate 1-carboxyvinyltransferase [Candidatus Lambdaproteobacteria bacterium]
MDRLVLQPIRRIAGRIVLPGSKSLSNRMLLLAAMAEGESQVANVLDSDDVRVMIDALRQLGVGVAGAPGHEPLRVTGCGGPLPGGTHRLFLGNAGTAMRPLAAVLAAGWGDYTLEGVARMHERPIGDLVAGLRQLGAPVEYLGREGYPPLRIRAEGLRGGDAAISGVTSSQFLTALLLAAPLAAGEVRLRIVDRLVSRPYVEMTIALMARFGVGVEPDGPLAFRVPAGQRYRSPGRAFVEGDASSASYFLAGAAITGGTVRVEGCGSESLQGDARFATLLERMGARVRWEPEAIELTGPGGPLRGVDADLADMPDAAMTLAVAALFARGPTTLRGIGNWRVKETDRMAAVSAELGKLGARTEVGADALVIHPPARVRGATIATYDDHRMAMAFSLAACGPEPVTILDPGCVAKTFPTYFEELAHLTRAE